MISRPDAVLNWPTASRKALKELGLRDGVMRKKPQGKPTSYWHHLCNKLIAKRRFVTERTFGTLKRGLGCIKTNETCSQGELRLKFR